MIRDYFIPDLGAVFALYTGNPRKSAQGGITGLGGQNEKKEEKRSLPAALNSLKGKMNLFLLIEIFFK